MPAGESNAKEPKKEEEQKMTTSCQVEVNLIESNVGSKQMSKEESKGGAQIVKGTGAIKGGSGD